MSRFLISFIGITLKNLQQSFLNLSLKFAIFLDNTVYSIKDILTFKKAFYNRHASFLKRYDFRNSYQSINFTRLIGIFFLYQLFLLFVIPYHMGSEWFLYIVNLITKKYSSLSILRRSFRFRISGSQFAIGNRVLEISEWYFVLFSNTVND